MEWTFWSLLGIILLPLYSVVLSIGVAPFLYIVGRELGLLFGRGCSAAIEKFQTVSKTSAHYRLAMLAARTQPERWTINDNRRMGHPEVGVLYDTKNGACIGFQVVPSWQFNRIYQEVLDGQAMAKMRKMTDETGVRLKKDVKRLGC